MSDDEAKPNNPPALPVKAPPKPSRPLTCYGIFSVLERNIIWQQNQKSTGKDTATDPYAATRPERYRHLELPDNWYMAGKNTKKRAEHVIHGKITFKEMSKVIAEKWRTVDAETRAYCEMIANDEMDRHKQAVAEFKEKYGEEAFKSQTSSCKIKEKRKREVLEAEGSVETRSVSQNNNMNENLSNVGAAQAGVSQLQLSYQLLSNSGIEYSVPSLPNYTTETNNYGQLMSNTGKTFPAAGECCTPAIASMGSSHSSPYLNNNVDTAYCAGSFQSYASNLNATQPALLAINNSNITQQNNAPANTSSSISNNFNAQLNNNTRTSFGATSVPSYGADFSMNALMQSALNQTNNNYNNQYNVGNANPTTNTSSLTNSNNLNAHYNKVEGRDANRNNNI